MLVKFEQNRMVQATQNFELCWQKKKRIFITVLTKSWRHFEDVSVAENIV